MAGGPGPPGAVGWSDPGLASAILALAEADAAFKGWGRTPVYAVERVVLTIARARRHP